MEIAKVLYTKNDIAKHYMTLSEKKKKKYCIVAQDKSEKLNKEYFIVKRESVQNGFETNCNYYECLFGDEPVKVYFDIDDTESETLEESQQYVDELYKDFVTYFKLYNADKIEITSHGFSPKKNKYKFSYTIMINNYNFKSINHHKYAVQEFLEKFPVYSDILDTNPYMKFQTFRAVNQTKFGSDRPNKLQSKNTIQDTVISDTEKCTEIAFDIPNVPLKKKKKKTSGTQRSSYTQTNNKSNTIVRKIVCELLPMCFSEIFEPWNFTSSFIKTFGHTL